MNVVSVSYQNQSESLPIKILYKRVLTSSMSPSESSSVLVSYKEQYESLPITNDIKHKEQLEIFTQKLGDFTNGFWYRIL